MDCLIREARIVDGTGGPWFVSDVLSAMGASRNSASPFEANGAHVVDAQISLSGARLHRCALP